MRLNGGDWGHIADLSGVVIDNWGSHVSLKSGGERMKEQTYTVIYYHPTFRDSTLYFNSEDEAIDFAARWMATHGCHTDLTEQESLTVVFN